MKEAIKEYFPSLLVGLGSFFLSGYGFESSIWEGLLLAAVPLMFYTLGLYVMRGFK